MVHFQGSLWTRFLIITVLTLSLIASTALASQLDDKQKQLNDVKAQIQANKQKLDETNQHEADTLNAIKSSDEKITQLQTDIINLQKELDQTTAKRKGVEAQLNETQKRLNTAQAELYSAQNKLSQTRMAYNNRINNIYRGGAESVLEILLNSQSLADLLERTSFINMIAESDAKLVHGMKQLTKTISEKVAEIDSEKERFAKQRLSLTNEEKHITAVKNKIIAQQKIFKNELNSQKALLAQIQKQKTDIEVAEDMAEASENMIANQIRALQSSSRQVSRGSVGSGLGGHFIHPVDAPITSPFGMRFHPILHIWRMHTGIDFGCSYGTPVHAAASGMVIMAGYMSGYGNAVVIDHGNGLSTLYGHLSSIGCSVGENVGQGQVIADSGNSGLSTGPHLHFEIRVNGTPEDPMKWLS